jgi:hypothetical protein
MSYSNPDEKSLMPYEPGTNPEKYLEQLIAITGEKIPAKDGKMDLDRLETYLTIHFPDDDLRSQVSTSLEHIRDELERPIEFKRAALSVEFRPGRHIEVYDDRSRLSGYDWPDRWRGEDDTNYAHAVVIDLRSVLSEHPSLAFSAPMVGIEDKPVSEGVDPILREHFAGLGTMDTVDPKTYAEFWKDHGARIGKVEYADGEPTIKFQPLERIKGSLSEYQCHEIEAITLRRAGYAIIEGPKEVDNGLFENLRYIAGRNAEGEYGISVLSYENQINAENIVSAPALNELAERYDGQITVITDMHVEIQNWNRAHSRIDTEIVEQEMIQDLDRDISQLELGL